MTNVSFLACEYVWWIAWATVALPYVLYLIAMGAGAWKLELRRKSDFRQKSPGTLPSATVVVPARNEAERIGRCLESLRKQTIPIEILVVDDDSDDGTRMAAEAYAVKVLTVVGSGKKAALTTGIAAASGEIILTTDADSWAEPEWAETLLQLFDASTVFVAGPVRMTADASVFGALQALESTGLMGLAGGGFAVGFPQMANGANLAFRKSAFFAVGGYGCVSPASGDDMFLVEKLCRIGGGKYAWDERAVVHTSPCSTWNEFWHQRLRWAGKNRRYSRPVMAVIQLSALFSTLFIPSALISGEWRAALWIWTVKAALEFWPLLPAALF
ncbi:MAG: glycosyltransferase, partial [Bacteroidia bacterium]|nr:glycosyltransferase [Bacteroidia bacterium]